MFLFLPVAACLSSSEVTESEDNDDLELWRAVIRGDEEGDEVRYAPSILLCVVIAKEGGEIFNDQLRCHPG